jgi:hypothetical protein
MINQLDIGTTIDSAIVECPSQIKTAQRKFSFVDRVAVHLDLTSDKMVRLHFKEWRRNIKNHPSRPKDIIQILKSKESLHALAKCEAAGIEVQAAVGRYKLALNKFRIIVEEFEEGIHPDTDWEFEIVRKGGSNRHEVFLVKTEESVTKKTMSDLFYLSKELINATESELESLREGHFPKVFESIFEHLKGLEQFVKDLVEMLLENPHEGRKIINDVCTRKSVAESTLNDESKPEPIRFLAKLALKELA